MSRPRHIGKALRQSAQECVELSMCKHGATAYAYCHCQIPLSPFWTWCHWPLCDWWRQSIFVLQDGVPKGPRRIPGLAVYQWPWPKQTGKTATDDSRDDISLSINHSSKLSHAQMSMVVFFGSINIVCLKFVLQVGLPLKKKKSTVWNFQLSPVFTVSFRSQNLWEKAIPLMITYSLNTCSLSLDLSSGGQSLHTSLSHMQYILPNHMHSELHALPFVSSLLAWPVAWNPLVLAPFSTWPILTNME